MMNIVNNQAKVLVVSLPGVMQNLLRDTFTRRDDIEMVEVASGGLSAISLIRHLQPDLVVVDANLPEAETTELIEWIKEWHQPICTLILTETSKQLSKATKNGADYILRSYSLPENLDRVLGNLNINQGSNKEQ